MKLRIPFLAWIVIFLSVAFLHCSGNSDRTHFTDRALADLAKVIPYPSDYKDHLQGMTTDYRNYLYWSHTTVMVKSDLQGKILKSVEVAGHHGDLAYHDKKLYVAVNFGRFNEEPGLADSWIYVYDAKTLRLLRKYPLPEVVHGAGGITFHRGQFMVVGGLPNLPGYERNFVYEYDSCFNLKKIHSLESGYTRLGIQTATWFDGFWYFGCYSSPQHPEGIVLKAVANESGSLQLVGTYAVNMSYGMIGLQGNQFLCSNDLFDHQARVLTLNR